MEVAFGMLNDTTMNTAKSRQSIIPSNLELTRTLLMSKRGGMAKENGDLMEVRSIIFEVFFQSLEFKILTRYSSYFRMA